MRPTALRGGGFWGGVSALALGQVADGGSDEHLVDRFFDVLPDVPLGAAVGQLTLGSIVDTVEGGGPAFERRDDVVQGDFRGSAGEGVSTLGATAAADEAEFVKRGEDLIEVGLGDALAPGDVGASQRLQMVGGESRQGT